MIKTLYKAKDNKLVIENYQRNYIKNTLNYANDEDLVIISDCDEIPNLNKKLISKIKKSKYFKNYFYQKFYYYKPNLQLFEKYFFSINKLDGWI